MNSIHKEEEYNLKIYIGKNKTGKTQKLEKIRDEASDKKKVLFIPGELDLQIYLNNSNVGTFAKPVDSPQKMVINFINKIYEIKLKKFKFNEEDVSKIQENFKSVSIMKTSIDKSFKTDFYAEEEISNIIQINTNYNKEDYEHSISEPLLLSKNKDINNYSSSGSRYYSMLKLIIESLNQIPEESDLSDFLIILDEPEKFCHPELISKITDKIYDIAKKIKVVIATHSQMVSSRLYLKSISVNNGDSPIIKFIYTSFSKQKLNDYESIKNGLLSFIESNNSLELHPSNNAIIEKLKKPFLSCLGSNLKKDFKDFVKTLDKDKDNKNKDEIKEALSSFEQNIEKWETQVFCEKELDISNVLKKSNIRRIKQLFEILFASNLILFEGLIEEEFSTYLINKHSPNKYFTLIDCNGKDNIMPMIKIIQNLGINSYLHILIIYDQDDDKDDNNMQCNLSEVTKMIFVPDFEKHFFNFEEDLIEKLNCNCKQKKNISYLTNENKKITKKEIEKLSVEDILNKSTREDIKKQFKDQEDIFKNWVSKAI